MYLQWDSVFDFLSMESGYVEPRSYFFGNFIGFSALIVPEVKGWENFSYWVIRFPWKRILKNFVIVNEFLLKFLEERAHLLKLIFTRQ